MDRNSAIGLTLIAALLLAYFYWFAPKPEPPASTPETEQAVPAGQPEAITDDSKIAQLPDSALAAAYGDLTTYVRGTESLTDIETEDLRISFSNKGGLIRELELKKYKTYHGQPLILVQPTNTSFELISSYKGKDIDLYDLYYKTEQRKVGDTTQIVFTIESENGASLSQVYSVPAKGYEIGYAIINKGMNDLAGDLQLNWTSFIRPTEKDLKDMRNNTTITYYTVNDGFDKISETSVDTEIETFKEPVKWVGIKAKFFLSSLIAKNSFEGAQLEISTNLADTSVVKRANISIAIDGKDATDGKANFKYYFGPNDYQEIGGVAEDFKRNVYLGWPPVYWVNKFVIFPVFHFLTLHLTNYGVIIIILVLLLKLVLAPLSYRSYLSMAKMKVLKPELDEIKAKHGEDMTKVQQEQLKLYQQVGVNPLSGCIPLLLQMPLILAMFYLFPASIELRQQPLLWAEDLSTYDSLITLPFTIPFGVGDHISLFTVMMTLTTLISVWQNNQMSAVQGPMKSMSYIMPLIFFFVLNSFSAGLTFYYLVTNLVTFAQQAIIRKFVDEEKIKRILEENRKKNISGGAKKSKFMAKLEDAMKASEEARRAAEEARKKKKK